MEAKFYVWLHVLSFAVYTGSTLAVGLIYVRRASSQSDGPSALRSIAAVMRVYDPLSIAMLGLMVMSGAFMLTAFKSALRENFFAQMGRSLAWKLLFAFLLVNLGAYIAFGIGHRLVRTLDSEQPVDESWLRSMLVRLRGSTIAAAALALWTAWIALGMFDPVPKSPTPASSSFEQMVPGGSGHGMFHRRQQSLVVQARETQQEQPLHHRAALL